MISIRLHLPGGRDGRPEGDHRLLVQAYAGLSLRRDLEALAGDVELSELSESLTRHSLDESVIVG